MPSRRHFGSVRKRGRIWEASYWHGGRRHLADIRFLTAADARVYLAAVELSIRRGSWLDPGARLMPVHELARRWLASNPSKRPTTAATDRIAVDRHIVPALGDHNLEDVSLDDVQVLVNQWAIHQAPRTVRRNYAVLKAIFAYAVDNDWLGRSPCRRVHLPEVTSTRRHDLTPEDVARIAGGIPERYRPMVWLGAVLGLRWSEVLGLRLRALDLERRTLTVAEAVTRDLKGRPMFGPPKSQAGRRTMGLPKPLVQLLAEHLARYREDCVSEDLVFTDGIGGVVNQGNFRNRIWLPAVRAAGCEGAGFHDLRRLAATTLVLEGVDVKTAQHRLGHSDPRMTLAVYAAAPVAADRAAAERLGERFFPIGPEVEQIAGGNGPRGTTA
ncbi:MAG TPA: tyrosine-type recombinase/integrase [Acidimicrobiales bacterium]|nr:tyrosine-type recombinase/integrase [Acidimicrobiales bacterium]